MVKLTFIQANNESVEAEIESGSSLMEAAINADVEGILAECGGSCSCATCHIKVPAQWREKLPQATELEMGMLEFAEDLDEGSRLACQVIVNDELDGMTVNVVE